MMKYMFWRVPHILMALLSITKEQVLFLKIVSHARRGVTFLQNCRSEISVLEQKGVKQSHADYHCMPLCWL